MLRAALSLLVLSGSAFGLDIGGAAPPLRIASWFNGGPVSMNRGSVYIVEFWATWCGPCLQTMPHLSRLQKKLGGKGLTVIGVSSEQRDTVKAFLEKHPELDYRVGVDDGNQTYVAWMQGIPGIPYAFLIDREGVVVWKGHPLAGLDRTVERVLAGTYGANERKAQQLEGQLEGYLRMNQLGAAETACFEILALDPENAGASDLLFRIYRHLEKPIGQLYPKLARTFAGKPEALARLALSAATQEDVADRDLALAVTCLKEAQRLSKRRSAIVLSAQARIEYTLGLIPRAIQSAREAAEAAEDEDEKKRAEAEAAYYQAALEAQKQLLAG